MPSLGTGTVSAAKTVVATTSVQVYMMTQPLSELSRAGNVPSEVTAARTGSGAVEEAVAGEAIEDSGTTEPAPGDVASNAARLVVDELSACKVM